MANNFCSCVTLVLVGICEFDTNLKFNMADRFNDVI